MQENVESTNKENIQLNIKVGEIEPLIHDAPKTSTLLPNLRTTFFIS